MVESDWNWECGFEKENTTKALRVWHVGDFLAVGGTITSSSFVLLPTHTLSLTAVGATSGRSVSSSTRKKFLKRAAQ